MIEWFLELEFFAQGLMIICSCGILAVLFIFYLDRKDKVKLRAKAKQMQFENICGKMS